MTLIKFCNSLPKQIFLCTSIYLKKVLRTLSKYKNLELVYF